MNTKKRTAHALQWVWSHTSALVALLLIIGALLVGYSIGSSPDRAATGLSSDVHDQHAEHAQTAPMMYTCSMHPSVRLTDPDAKCPICFMDLIPVVEHAGSGISTQLTLSREAAAASMIETAVVTRSFPTAQTRLYGKLVYDETSVARISAYFAGRIDRLFVNYVGVPVQKGDHLAEIYSPDLLAAFEELRQAKHSSESAGDSDSFLAQTSRQTLTASREKLRLFGLTPDQIHGVESGAFDSDALTIYAPIGGVVTHLATREGDYLKTGDPIATVSDLSRLWLDLEAYESQLPMLRWGLAVRFTVEAHPGEVFEGRVSFIEPLIDERLRTATVRVAVDNSDGRLKPGMFASATAMTTVGADGTVVSDELAGRWVCPMHPSVISEHPGACDICGMDLVGVESLRISGRASVQTMPLVIPRSAVLFTGVRSLVYVEVPDADQPTYEGRVVELGVRAGEFYTVRSGLVEGDRVVVNGAFRIDSAMQILAKPSMMMPGGGVRGGGHQHGGDAMNMPTPKPKQASGVSVVDQLTPVYNNYLDAQERLAADDHAGFVDAVGRLGLATGALNTEGITEQSLAAWTRAKDLLEADEDLSTMDDARAAFERMSEGVLILQDKFGHPGSETLNTVFCSMAFDFKGAHWLQRGREINNPYFGSEMLRCGEIQATHTPIEGEGP